MKDSEEIRVKRHKKDKAVKNTAVIVMVILVTLILIGLAFYIRGNNGSKPSTTPDHSNTNNTPMQQVVTSHVKTYFGEDGDLYYDMATQKLYFTMSNAEDNSSNVQYTISIKETNEVIYTSNVLKPGEKITECDCKLEGYEADTDLAVRVQIMSLDATNGEQLNGVIKSKTLHILSEIEAETE